ncbi:MAG: hypothetical protein NXI07_04790 [bacterium]|nr:hypothetical protein [bacterium]
MNEQRGILARIRTVIIVTLIAAMLWLLAESRMVRTRTIEAQLAITSVEPSGVLELVVRQAPGATRTRTVELELEGSTAGIDRLIRQLQSRVELRLGREIPARPGLFVIDLRAELRRSPDLDMHGVTIKTVSPETVQIEVDELEMREFPVRVSLPEGVQTDGAPRAEPALVRMQGPSSVFASVENEFARVTLTQEQIDQLTPGRLDTFPGAVVQIDGIAPGTWSTTLEPAQVDVLLELKSVTQRLELDALPVQVLIAPAEIGKWRVELDDADRDLIGVMVEGPVEAIEALRTDAVRPRALVSLTFEELERGVQAAPAQIVNLPPGCRVVSTDRTVGLQITRLPQDEPNPAVENPSQP